MADTIVPARRAPSQKTGMERVLDGIERLGNKMPDPAILFLWLCLGVILLSQALAWLDVKATYQVVAPPPVPAEETYYGGSSDPVYVAPVRAGARRGLRGADRDDRGQGPADRRRHPLPVHVVRRQLPQLRRGGDHPGGDDRRRPGRGGRADRGADPQARRGLLARHAHVHHRAARHDLERRLRRGLHRADTPGRGGVPERRPPSDRRHRGRVRRRRRGLRGELPDHAAGRRADRDHQRRVRAGRPERGDRPRGEPVLRHRLGAVRHRRC